MKLFDEFDPTMYEVQMAEDTFRGYIAKNLECTALPPKTPGYISQELLLRLALARVWTEGKRWQAQEGGRNELLPNLP